MNSTSKYICFSSLFLVFVMTGCQSVTKYKNPEIRKATYTPYQIAEEKGYEVKFEVYPEMYEATAVVFNKIRQPIFSKKKENFYTVNIVASTKLIENHQIKTENKENGVYILKDNQEIFIPAKFARK